MLNVASTHERMLQPFCHSVWMFIQDSQTRYQQPHLGNVKVVSQNWQKVKSGGI